MSLYELAAIALGWLTIAYVIAAAWRRFCSRQPRIGAPRCACGICTGRVQVRDLLLTGRQLADVRDGVIAVGMGLTHVATLGVDHVGAGGVGQVVVVVFDEPLWTGVVAPSIQGHYTARAT